ncbi:MAG TPA: SDR family oxidoreductase [Caulobacteraceae bacterium]|jgi:NAD(P)-dependent dehydrogenase (short-subunit alcohol dehydrogenase family)
MPKALIVGASRGLGLGLVEEFARRGWEVLATVRDPARAPELGQLALGGKTRIEPLDVTRTETAAALDEALADEVFDLLFLNAGMGNPPGKRVANVSDAEMWALFETNALGPVRTAEMLAGHVRPRTGVVAFMTSRLGSVADKTSEHAELYSATKAALNSFSRSFAARHTQERLTVLSLHPGWVRTEIGGPNAPLDVETSVRGLADVVEAARGTGVHRFLDYTGAEIPW